MVLEATMWLICLTAEEEYTGSFTMLETVIATVDEGVKRTCFWMLGMLEFTEFVTELIVFWVVLVPGTTGVKTILGGKLVGKNVPEGVAIGIKLLLTDINVEPIGSELNITGELFNPLFIVTGTVLDTVEATELTLFFDTVGEAVEEDVILEVSRFASLLLETTDAFLSAAETTLMGWDTAGTMFWPGEPNESKIFCPVGKTFCFEFKEFWSRPTGFTITSWFG